MSEMPQAKPKIVGLVVIGFFLAFGSGYLTYASFAGAWPWNESTIPSPVRSAKEVLQTITQTPTATAEAFAQFTLPSFSFTPSVEPYTVASNLSNVTNLDQFAVELSDSAKALLPKNGFVVKAGTEREFFPMYERNRYSYIPNFVTTDSLLHTVHLYFDYLLKETEEDKLVPTIQTLTEKMQTASAEQYRALKGTDWESAAKRNLAFFSVARQLIDPSGAIPADVKTEVETDLDRIANPPDEMLKPASMLIGNNEKTSLEDYSQYVPRSHYTESEALQKYWRTMMWFGRLTFLMKIDSEVQSATLMTITLRESEIRTLWGKVYEPTNFFVGKSDDITYTDLNSLLSDAFGTSFALSDVTSDSTKYDAYYQATGTLAPPQVNSIPIPGTSLAPSSNRDDLITGFRFMGQRFTLDASIFQRLICREVGNKDGSMDCPKPTTQSRMLPNGLDIPSAMGSDEAKAILRAVGEEEYKNYPEQLAKVREGVGKVTDTQWTQNLYWSWLYSLRPMVTPKGEGYPSFMRNSAWDRKGLNTYLGSWAELKHDTLLYSKQAYAELGGGPPEEKDDRGYVEPEPIAFARMAGLVGMMRDGLSQRGLLSDATKASLDTLVQLATDLTKIAAKELNAEALSTADYQLIKTYGGQLEHFWTDVNKDKMGDVSQIDFLNENPSAIVADVATDPNGSVLEVATGYIDTIYAIVSLEGKLRIVKGGVFSYYEFPHPLNDRLTDKAWRKMLDEGKAPAVPTWTSAYRVAR